MTQKKVSWPIVFWIVLLHVGALAAPFYFSWSAFALFVGLSIFTGMAITLGYHRLFTHASFVTYKPVEWAIALAATLAGQGGIFQWVADHRRHHKFADADGDPHSPREGFWWAHATWNFYNGPQPGCVYFRRYVPDLLEDRVFRALHALHVPLHLILAAVLYAIGGMPWLLWGMAARLVYVLHTTWLVNSVTHWWGYRNYQTRDSSTNNPLVALLTFGEGWHNNHHAQPRAANHGHVHWWEFDPTYRVIRLMECFGLAWNVKQPTWVCER